MENNYVPYGEPVVMAIGLGQASIVKQVKIPQQRLVVALALLPAIFEAGFKHGMYIGEEPTLIVAGAIKYNAGIALKHLVEGVEQDCVAISCQKADGSVYSGGSTLYGPYADHYGTFDFKKFPDLSTVILE